jgi:hypothetical protein
VSDRRRRYLALRRTPPTRRVDAPRGYPTHIDVPVGGKVERIPVSYWRKVAIKAGRYVHPTTGERFAVPTRRMDRWVKTFQWMKGRGITVPTPVDHSDAADDNRGFVVDVQRRGDDLVVTQQAIGRDAALLAARSRCSLLVDDYVDERTGKAREAILHNSYTAKPVIGGCGEHVPFAASRSDRAAGREGVPVFYLSRDDRPGANLPESDMKLTKEQKAKIRAALDLDDDAPVGQTELDRFLALESEAEDAADDAGDADADDDAAEDADDSGEEDADEDADDADAEDAADDGDAEGEEDAADAGKAGKSGKGDRKPAMAGAGLSRGTDRATGLLLSRALKTEIQSIVRKGCVTAAVGDALETLFFPGNRPTPTALSRVDGSDDPYAFHVIKILKQNKPPARPLNGNGRTGSQHGQATALERAVPGGLSRSDRADLDRELRQAAKWARRHGRQPAAAK